MKHMTYTEVATSPHAAPLPFIVNHRYDRRMAMPMESSPPLFDVDESQAALFHALAEPTRLALLQHLSTGEHRVRVWSADPAEEARLLEEGRPFAWRLSLDRARETLGEADWSSLTFIEEGQGPGGEHGVVPVRPEAAGDVVLARKDTGVAYHLAVTHDDALQGITHVIRGQDLFEATHVQRLIQTLMGWPAPTYRHHRLLTGPDGRRYAKRDRSVTLAELRAGGVTAEALRAELGFSSVG